MLLLIALMACSTGDPTPTPAGRPSAVPEGAVAIHLDADGLRVGDRVIGDRASMERDLVDGLHGPLLEALPQGPTQAWIEADGELPWVLVRKLAVSADHSGYTERWVGTGDRAYGPSTRPRARFRPDCPDGPIAVEGVSRRVIVEIFHGSDGTWVEATALFHPTIDGVPALGLPEKCWSGLSCDLAGDAAASCKAAVGSEPAPGRVAIAGPIGCLLPIRKQPGQEASWPEELAANLKQLGITAKDEATLMVEANAPWAAAVAVMEGFDRAGLPAPGLGLPLVEGHGRPPLCTATVRDAQTLETAGAKWLGSRVQPEPSDH